MIDRMLRPMSLPDIFDEGFDLYKKNLSAFLLIAAVVAVPVKMVEAFLSTGYVSDAQGMLNSFVGNTDSTGFLFWFYDFVKKASLPNLCFAVAYAVSICALAEAASRRYAGRAVTLGEAYRVPLRRPLKLIGGTLLYLLGIAGGLFLCVVGVIWPLISWLFAAHAFAFEGKGPVESLKRSAALVSNDSGRVFGSVLMLLLLGLIIQVGLEYPIAYAFELLLKLTPQTQDWLSTMIVGGLSWRDRAAGEIASAVSILLLMPFFISVLTVLYYDLRVRKEAYDVELIASDLGYASLAEHAGYLPAAMAFQQFVRPGAPGSGAPPPRYGAPPSPGYAPPPYGSPPPGYVPPAYGQPPSTAGNPPSGYGTQPAPSVPSPGWQPTGTPIVPQAPADPGQGHNSPPSGEQSTLPQPSPPGGEQDWEGGK